VTWGKSYKTGDFRPIFSNAPANYALNIETMQIPLDAALTNKWAYFGATFLRHLRSPNNRRRGGRVRLRSLGKLPGPPTLGDWGKHPMYIGTEDVNLR